MVNWSPRQSSDTLYKVRCPRDNRKHAPLDDFIATVDWLISESKLAL